MAIIKIGQMTDTHDGDLRAAVDLLNREKVDIGVHSGDIVPENYTAFAMHSLKLAEECNVKEVLARKQVQKAVEEHSSEVFRQILENPQNRIAKNVLLPLLDEYDKNPDDFVSKLKQGEGLLEEFQGLEKEIQEKSKPMYEGFFEEANKVFKDFNGEFYITPGNHDPSHQYSMKDFPWTKGYVTAKGLKFLFLPECQEGPYVQSEKRETLEDYVADAADKGADPQEAELEILSKMYPDLDLKEVPDICYFHKVPGSNGGNIERIRKYDPNISEGGPMATHIMKRYGNKVIYYGGGHYHGGFFGVEDGVRKIVGSPNSIYIKFIDAESKKLVKLQKWVYHPYSKEQSKAA